MTIEITSPVLPESVSDAEVTLWHKKEGDSVRRDEVLAEIETDKIVLEVVAPQDGVISKILHPQGSIISSNEVLAILDFSNEENAKSEQKNTACQGNTILDNPQGPMARRMLGKFDLTADKVQATGKKGHLLREDFENFEKTVDKKETASGQNLFEINKNEFKRVPMTRLRKRIAERLLDAKNNTAMLTTFNEVDMKPIMDLRKQYGEKFLAHHKVKLGFMSFYVKAVVSALKKFPEINATIDSDEIVYFNSFDISIAVSTERGLVTPVIRDCDQKSLSEIEQEILQLAQKGRENKLTVDDLTGGNFTITNGGVFGSLLSTPILNPPQSAILGMHTIKDRPIALNGEVVIRPMMYLALSYDHRLVDGKDAVGFLVHIKEILEDPNSIIIECV